MLSVEMARFRAKTMQALRTFFDTHDYLELDTPLLADALIPEPHIEVFASDYVHPHELGRTLYLIPSPEVWMKRLLAAGYGNIYQICHCFRNAESVGNHHAPEFKMLEWYSIDAGYHDSADMTDHLLGYLCQTLGDHPEAAALSRCAPPAERIAVAEAFERYAGVDPDVFDEPHGMIRAARELGMCPAGEGAERSEEDIFHQILLTYVEPTLPTDRPVMLFDYPAFVPTLAMSSPGSRTAERWELYIGGLEIANCFTEERDPGILANYLQEAGEQKLHSLVPHPTDEKLRSFAQAPRCSGVALGVDRLIMATSGVQSIQGVISFPLF